MADAGIDITSEFPKPWTDEIVRASDVVVTMGCGDACPLFPGKRYEDWELQDPAGLDVADVIPIRDEIRARVEGLMASLGIEPVADLKSGSCARADGRRQQPYHIRSDGGRTLVAFLNWSDSIDSRSVRRPAVRIR